jgi:tripartite-type tricarboxylate transporter receptor subunit TctC
MKLKIHVVIAALLCSTVVLAQGVADTFPNKPVRIILPFGRGGSSDTFVRAMQPKLETALGQPVVLENVMGGTGGSKGAEVAAAAAPDGYTLLVMTIGNAALLPVTYPEYGIEPLRDLAPVTRLAELPNVLVARSSLPADTFEEMVDLAKSRPGQITYSGPGLSLTSIHGVEFAAIIKERGIDLKQLPIEGGNNGALEALKTGTLDVFMTTSPYVLPGVRSGVSKALAIAATQRSPAFPGIPMMTEVGVPTLSAGSWMGMLAPAGTPQPVLDKLFMAITTAAQDPELKRIALDDGMVVSLSRSPDDFRAFIESETARLRSVVAGFGPAAR